MTRYTKKFLETRVRHAVEMLGYSYGPHYGLDGKAVAAKYLGRPPTYLSGGA